MAHPRSAAHRNLAVNHSARAAEHRLDGLLEDTIQLARLVHARCEHFAPSRSLGNSTIVWRRIEGNVDLVVGCLGPEAVGVHK